ncbi:MAG: carboxypeptidase regulatory-like domain-containing protein [Deltaproteobacteria bacterium]|nr:carboxypeptidase regulatory-like domain-containing protein [Deltaproteobacteria bacterium]
MTHRKILAVLMVTAFLAVFTASCTDQSKLSGTVTWQDTGGGTEGVSVILFNAVDNATMDNATTEDDYTIVTTDKDGKYTFTGLSASSYIVYAALEGYKFAPATREVEVKGITARIDFTAYENEFEIPENGPYTGAYMDCSNGCLPGVNACSNCCNTSFDPCFDACFDAYYTCTVNCDPYDYSYPNCKNACDQTRQDCYNNCNYGLKQEFDCPDFMPPKTCPYNCQAWNSAGRSCVGAPMNACN